MTEKNLLISESRYEKKKQGKGKRKKDVAREGKKKKRAHKFIGLLWWYVKSIMDTTELGS